MVERAAIDHNLDLTRSVMIGDSRVDLGLGWVVGCKTALVRTGYGEKVEAESADLVAASRAHVYDDLLLAVKAHLSS